MQSHCEEYENIYESEYDSTYDQNFVYYDEEDGFEDEESDEGADSFDDEDYDSEDLILEEIPFVYCPSREEIVEA